MTYDGIPRAELAQLLQRRDSEIDELKGAIASLWRSKLQRAIHEHENVSHESEYRGLLAMLSPRFEVQQHDLGLLVATYLTVPHVDTGEPFVLRTSEVIADDSALEAAIARCFQRSLEHEVREGLGLNGH